MRERSALEVLSVFLRLGASSFGGPIAHLGYFRAEFVERRGWISDAAYSDLVALCQFLPGPSSSQVGFSLGLLRAGYWGGLAAWLGFTLPSALLMTLAGFGASGLSGLWGGGVVHGLKLVALAIVADAVIGMTRALCPDPQRIGIGLAAGVIVLQSMAWWGQLAAILMGGLVGLLLCRASPTSPESTLALPISRRTGALALGLFLVLLGVSLALGPLPDAVDVFAGFYRAGALVFGGGHVVLPLLRDIFVARGWVTDGAFLSGYGAAQALPGPLFAFAAYLGAISQTSVHGVAGAMLGLVALFLPGLLLVVGVLPFWAALRRAVGVQASLAGINAAVVGLLAAALYDPLWTGSVHSIGDLLVALAALLLRLAWRVPPLVIVVIGILGGIGLERAA